MAKYKIRYTYDKTDNSGYGFHFYASIGPRRLGAKEGMSKYSFKAAKFDLIKRLVRDEEEKRFHRGERNVIPPKSETINTDELI